MIGVAVRSKGAQFTLSEAHRDKSGLGCEISGIG